MLIVGRLGDGFGERLGRFSAHHIMNTIDISPPLPRCEQTGERVGKPMLECGHDDAARRARHTLHIAQNKGRGDGVRLAGATTSHDDGGLGGDVLREELWFVEIDALGMEPGFGVPEGGVDFVVLTSSLLFAIT